MKRTFTSEQEESFREGRISAFEEIGILCEHRIENEKISDRKTVFSQTSAGGKIKAYGNIKNICKQKIEKSKSFKP